MQNNGLHANTSTRSWSGNPASLVYDEAGIKSRLNDLSQPIYLVQYNGQIGATHEGQLTHSGQYPLAAMGDPITPEQFGDHSFQQDYGVRYSYTSGAMAGGIASADLVIAMGRAGFLGIFGAAGVVSARVEEAIRRIQAELPSQAYGFNLIHSPSEEAMERRAVELYLQYGVTIVEASAFLDLTPHIVHYRAAGLSLGADGQVVIKNRVIAKVSRREVATKFMEPAPDRLLQPLVAQGLITAQQAELAKRVPVADDVTVEADSGGHTDNRPLVGILPSIMSLRDELQAKHRFNTPVRVGGGGGIGTPSAVLAAFMMGAAYVVTGSINQACVEAGTSAHTKKLLAQADMADVMMAPAADMFEMGVKVQLLKRGTMFPMRAQRLYELYRQYSSIDEIPTDEREKLEKQVLKRPMEDIWQDTVNYFMERDPEQIHRAKDNPKRKMALIFRWYLGLSSRWSTSGEKGREADYQIWCGPSMGAFNNWSAGSYLEQPENRRIAEVAYHMMRGAAYLYRMQQLRLQGLQFTPAYGVYVPSPVSLP